MGTIDLTIIFPPVLIISIIVSGPIFYSIYVERKSRRIVISDIEPMEFRILGWLKVFFLAGLSMPVLFIVWGWRIGWGGLAFIGTIGVIFLSMGIAALYYSVKAKITISSEQVTYYDGRREKAVRLDNIKFVSVANGFLFVHEDATNRRVAIPLIFSGNSKLIATLRFCAQRNMSPKTDL
jgi:hypothetical protein